MNHTTNYQLNQWAKSDQVLMEDFNADNAKLDAALAQKADASALAALTTLVGTPLKLAAGSYTGDGAETQVIPLPFTPKAVYVCSEYGATYILGTMMNTYSGGLAATGAPIKVGEYTVVEIVSGGFKVGFRRSSSWTITTNSEGGKLHYIALG